MTIENTTTFYLGTVENAPKITKIDLECEAKVASLDVETFLEHTEKFKKNCPNFKLSIENKIN